MYAYKRWLTLSGKGVAYAGRVYLQQLSSKHASIIIECEPIDSFVIPALFFLIAAEVQWWLMFISYLHAL